MTKQEFREFYQNKLIYLDGATGSNLQKAGMPTGVCPEQWILEHPDAILELQRAFVEAGTNILYAPTFTANRIKLAEYGLAEHLIDMNTELVRLAKQAAGGKALVAGDITMTGRQLTPMGDMDFEQLIDVYKEQIRVLDQAGVDLLVVETMMSLQETRAALIAAKEVSSLPVIASLTFESDNKTLFGTDPMTAMLVLQALGADVVGTNCSTGPDQMCEVVRQMKQVAKIPVLAKPNAGLPKLDSEGRTVYEMYKKGENVGETFEQESEKVDHLNQEIDEMEKKILANKGLKECCQCGKVISKESHFCPKCGAEQMDVDVTTDESVSKQKVCPKCNAICQEDSEYCENCGEKIS